jgi:hypothetical protein
MAAQLDPRVSLAAALESQPGVYALLIGSGVSTGAGVPTGWGVVDSLVRRVAVASGEKLDSTFDAETWWSTNGDGQPLGYSSILERLGPTRAARRALLAGFFEPTDEDRENELKVPSAAHRAIANLVRAGRIRVIVTTNFDHLLERAIEAEGVSVQVIATDSAVAGMEPLPHMQCTIVKLHGDYTSLDQRNTVDELSAYPKNTKGLLARIFDEYGLVISGWSGEWDPALVTALEASGNRRYPLFWVAKSTPGEVAKRILSRSGAALIEGATADEFFPDLLERVQALESMADSPDSTNMALARLKRALPDPTKHIEVRDLLDNELTKLSAVVKEVADSGQPAGWQAMEDGLRLLLAGSSTLIRLYSTGIVLDRDRQHDDLWVYVLQRAMAVRRPDYMNNWWKNYLHYPALLLMRAATMAALLANHEGVAKRVMQDASWSTPYEESGRPMPAWLLLHPWTVTDHEQLNSIPRLHLERQKWHWPASKLVREDLEPLMAPIVGDENYERLYHRAEYRAALAYQFGYVNGYRGHVNAGEFIGDRMWQWEKPGDPLMGIDFREHGEQSAWGRTDENAAWFDEQLDLLHEELKTYKRFG